MTGSWPLVTTMMETLTSSCLVGGGATVAGAGERVWITYLNTQASVSDSVSSIDYWLSDIAKSVAPLILPLRFGNSQLKIFV